MIFRLLCLSTDDVILDFLTFLSEATLFLPSADEFAAEELWWLDEFSNCTATFDGADEVLWALWEL